MMTLRGFWFAIHSAYPQGVMTLSGATSTVLHPSRGHRGPESATVMDRDGAEWWNMSRELLVANSAACCSLAVDSRPAAILLARVASSSGSPHRLRVDLFALRPPTCSLHSRLLRLLVFAIDFVASRDTLRRGAGGCIAIWRGRDSLALLDLSGISHAAWKRFARRLLQSAAAYELYSCCHDAITKNLMKKICMSRSRSPCVRSPLQLARTQRSELRPLFSERTSELAHEVSLVSATHQLHVVE
ncbi:uncharacterized protein B0H18DRAFT_953706 [Fomitopsis serialis]|uniref:uncharacterized protein n=1 Tax=Fomitopsis serialis TaxID=139415 RepID=UPI0020084568|nr:uncharacterized protein B0H18DRAFT_953706 [Neoantrodia serialis]KAH9929245.1 hypothetical protein B0H18DRAFT_953706 [Neoantrodia serialis]